MAVSLSTMSPRFLQLLLRLVPEERREETGGADGWAGAVTWAGLGSRRREAAEAKDSIADKDERCWDTWWELVIAVRAVCESHDKNFKLHALKFEIFFFPYSPDSISLRVRSIFSGTSGRYCLRQNLTLIAEVLHQ